MAERECFQRIALQQVHQAGQEADADGDGADHQQNAMQHAEQIERSFGSEWFGAGPVGAEDEAENDREEDDAGGAARQVEQRGEIDDREQPGGPEEPIGGGDGQRVAADGTAEQVGRMRDEADCRGDDQRRGEPGGTAAQGDQL